MTAEREGLADSPEVPAIVAEVCPCDGSAHDPGQSMDCGWADRLVRLTLTSDALADLLAARDRRVRGEALREAAEALGEGDGISRFIGMDSQPEAVRAEKRAQQWLRDRADQIEADE